MPYILTIEIKPPIKTISERGIHTMRMFSGFSVRTRNGCLKNRPIPSRLFRSDSSLAEMETSSSSAVSISARDKG